jgi:hypothetical protein
MRRLVWPGVGQNLCSVRRSPRGWGAAMQRVERADNTLQSRCRPAAASRSRLCCAAFRARTSTPSMGPEPTARAPSRTCRHSELGGANELGSDGADRRPSAQAPGGGRALSEV